MPRTNNFIHEPEAFLQEFPNISVVELLLSDINGVSRGKWAPISALKKIFEQGATFPLSLFGLDVWGREVLETGLHIESGDKDGICRPVPATLKPTGLADCTTAQLMLTMEDTLGAPFMGEPRQILSRQIKLMADKGLTACTAFELEFFLLDPKKTLSDGTPVPVDQRHGPERQNLYALDTLHEKTALLDTIISCARAQDIPVDTIVSEASTGQFEINLTHQSDALRAADAAVLLRRLIKICAKSFGLEASFMAKPFMEHPGNGMHVHLSLLDDRGQNIFSGDTGDQRLRHAVGGVLDTMAQCTLIFANTFNGFRRLQPGSYAPINPSWGQNNRSVSVRIPVATQAAKRLEHRLSGADANPYLVMSAILTGVRHGLEHKIEPPAPIESNAYNQTGAQLPMQPHTALQFFNTSAFAKDCFTELGHHLISQLKHAEFQAFANEITPLEHSTYG